VLDIAQIANQRRICPTMDFKVRASSMA
jgi:hypothetical protein